MEELIESIQEIGNRDFIDIIAIFSPVVLSIVAIVVSIYTVHRQNKIALFDKRYMVISKIRRLYTLNCCIQSAKSSKGVLLGFDTCFETRLSLEDKIDPDEAELIVRNKVKVLQEEVLMGEFLSKKGYGDAVEQIFKTSVKIIKKAIKNELDDKLNKELDFLWKQFEVDYFQRLTNATHLSVKKKYVMEVKKCLNYLKKKLLKKQK